MVCSSGIYWHLWKTWLWFLHRWWDSENEVWSLLLETNGTELVRTYTCLEFGLLWHVLLPQRRMTISVCVWSWGTDEVMVSSCSETGACGLIAFKNQNDVKSELWQEVWNVLSYPGHSQHNLDKWYSLCCDVLKLCYFFKTFKSIFFLLHILHIPLELELMITVEFKQH